MIARFIDQKFTGSDHCTRAPPEDFTVWTLFLFVSSSDSSSSDDSTGVVVEMVVIVFVMTLDAVLVVVVDVLRFVVVAGGKLLFTTIIDSDSGLTLCLFFFGRPLCLLKY